jgi:hypothetical protein
LTTCRRPCESRHQGLVGEDLVGEGLERRRSDRAEDRGELGLQADEVVLREHEELALVDRARVGPLD